VAVLVLLAVSLIPLLYRLAILLPLIKGKMFQARTKVKDKSQARAGALMWGRIDRSRHRCQLRCLLQPLRLLGKGKDPMLIIATRILTHTRMRMDKDKGMGPGPGKLNRTA